MKRLLTNVFLTGIISALLLGCSQNRVESGNSKETFVATVNGNIFPVTDEVMAQNSTQGLTIQGRHSSEIIVINIPAYKTPGKYSVDKGEVVALYSRSGQSESYSAMAGVGSGAVNITNQSGNNIRGTFSFKSVSDDGVTTVNITGGKFNLVMLQ